MSIANMADIALARREARRRKILENSHNRLQLISGKNDSEAPKGSPIIAPISVRTSEDLVSTQSSSISNCFLNNGIINTTEEPIDFLITNQDNLAIGEGDVSIPGQDLAAFLSNGSTTPDPKQSSTPLVEKLVNCKYDIVLLSLFIQILYSLSLLTHEKAYFFLPLLLYIITKYFWFPKQHNSNIANALLLLNGMSADRVQKIMSITQYISAFAQDVSVFLFTTICVQTLCLTLKDNFV